MYDSLFNPIKHAVDLVLISNITSVNVTTSPSAVKTSQLYCPGYNYDIFNTKFAFLLLVLIAIAYLFTIVVNLGNIVVEKQTKMKEYLKLVGIKWYVIWFTWFMRSFVIYLVLSLLLSIVTKLTLKPRLSGSLYGDKGVFLNTQWFLIFSVFIVYSVQTSMFTLLMGQIFSKTFIAKVIVIIFWVFTVIDFYSTMAIGTKYFICFIPNAALQQIITVIFQYERSSKSLSFSNMYTNLYNDSLNVGALLTMQLFWTVAYMPIAWYIERIYPGEYGAPLPFYFLFMPSYWFGPKRDDVADQMALNAKEEPKFGFEKIPEGLDMAISIQNVSKEFLIGFKKKTAVDNLSLDFYQNQITGLLGHNGAGKTTTTFMLCGIYAPDKGNAYILGSNIITQMNKIRSSIGFCPQHDILFDELTVAEHLEFVASIKGYPKKDIKQEIINISTFVGLQNDLEKKSKQLSGGMKRRLSVAMAFTGGSKVIILDEPTSGLDPFNRRTLWELIRKFKDGRTILLTTHFMEEADALSDRIAIMNHGQVKCCGSPIFLKNTFGSGYRLTLAKAERFNEASFFQVLKQSIDEYVVESNIAAEMTVAISFTYSNKLSTLLANIEREKGNIGIDGYGISSPTIEEVFIKVGSIDKDVVLEKQELDHHTEKHDENELATAFSPNFKRNSGMSLWMQQVKSLFIKRFYIFYRRYILAVVVLLLPFLLEVILVSLLPSQSTLTNSIKGTVSSQANYTLNIANAATIVIPYTLTGTYASSMSSLLGTVYTSAKKPGVTLQSLDASSTNVTDYVLALRKASISDLIYKYHAGLDLVVNSANKFSANIYYSMISYHSSANMLAEVDNLLLYAANGYSTSKTITTVNVPISSSSSLSNTTTFLDALSCLDTLPITILDMVNGIIVGVMIAVIVMYSAQERINGSKQLQLLSGPHYATYWFAHYLFDVLLFFWNIATMVIIMRIVASAKNDSSTEVYVIADASTGNLGYLTLLMFFSALVWPLFAYVWSFHFSTDVISFVSMAVFLGFLSFLDSILDFLQILLVNGGTANSSSNLVFAVRQILTLLFPNMTIKRAMYDLKIRSNSYCIAAVNQFQGTSYVVNQDVFSVSEPGIGLLFIFTFIQFCLFLSLIVLKEESAFSKLKELCCRCCEKPLKSRSIEQIEADVEEERVRVRGASLKELSKSEPLVVNNLFKTFKKGGEVFVAVDHLGFGVKRNECFGLLGLNGAGKTTTFKMLIGEIKPTSGDAFINGYNIGHDKSKARRNLGFCPQFDVLPEYLTVRNTFDLVAGLRGLERSSVAKSIDELIKVFKLNEFNDKLVQKLSGGNKRKVSSGIAFLGRPFVVFLDEPTTGMDPAARRYLWTVIKKARDLGMTIVLTTHSMEESEALSSRLGIMVNGQFKCLGSVQHLKSKYGKGYTLIIKCKGNADNQVLIVEEFIKKNIVAAMLKDKQQETLFYQIYSEDSNVKVQTISELFSLLEANKEQLNLETYSLSQTTLEQVFLSFAKEQSDENRSKFEREATKLNRISPDIKDDNRLKSAANNADNV